MPQGQKQEKISDTVKSVGLSPSQMEHLVMAYLCMEKPKVDWKKLGEFCKVTPSSARTVFTKSRRCLERWEDQRTAGAATKEAEETEEAGEDEEVEQTEETKHEEDDNEDSVEAVEAALAKDPKN
ncbi:hypothetical protein N7516_011340 [Penicillium verrucosum]|uniref:uncharacterized protein n=1 Tax=Penicillium verrucosum TaxID=60171 RepID=UPI00254500C5|nr:uncharacterized protein N7516_011340 [Penicillium verrucosum]KAJ5920482.1 hypothetical protein N7516_011340 [Penicillium verrucosum]